MCGPAAATALVSMHAEHSAGNFEEALRDGEPSVVLAAAKSLLLLHDVGLGHLLRSADQRETRQDKKGLIKEQFDTLKDKKKMALTGIRRGNWFCSVCRNRLRGLPNENHRRLSTDQRPIRTTLRRGGLAGPSCSQHRSNPSRRCEMVRKRSKKNSREALLTRRWFGTRLRKSAACPCRAFDFDTSAGPRGRSLTMRRSKTR